MIFEAFSRLFLVAAVTWQVATASYSYVGCFLDQASNPDLGDATMVFPSTGDDQLTLATCVEQCRAEGSPFVGLQRGVECHCGQVYGYYGEASNHAVSKCASLMDGMN